MVANMASFVANVRLGKQKVKDAWSETDIRTRSYHRPDGRRGSHQVTALDEGQSYCPPKGLVEHLKADLKEKTHLNLGVVVKGSH